jgi:hypothetical protein
MVNCWVFASRELTGEVVLEGEVVAEAEPSLCVFFLEAPKQPKLSQTLFPNPPMMAAALEEDGERELELLWLA